MHEVRLQIRWRDSDAYGHVNNSVYLTYLEEARDAWVELVLGGVSANTWDLVLARVAVDFRSELRQTDREVAVSCELESIGRASLRTRETIRKVDGTISAEATAVIVPRDPHTGRSRPLTSLERSALERELGSERARP